MRDLTKKCLDRLETLIDGRYVEQTRELQRRTFAFEDVDRIPTIISYGIPGEEWPSFTFDEIFHDREKMLLSELGNVYAGARLKDDRLYGIRANYGTGIVASLFGCPIRTFQNMLPCAVEGNGIENIRRIVAQGVPDLRGGICGTALETVSYYRDVLRDYPNLNRNVGSTLLDIQGTFDNASIVWGSDIYLGVYDEPDLLTSLLEVVAGTIREIVLEHRRRDGQDPHKDRGNCEHLGGICLRNDSCVNLSGDMYEALVKPFDQSLLCEFTGSVHFCGRAHQWWPRLLDMRGLKGINPYQGEFYSLKEMYQECKRSRIAIYNWTTPVQNEAKEIIHTGFSRVTWVSDFDEAQRALDRAHRTGWTD